MAKWPQRFFLFNKPIISQSGVLEQGDILDMLFMMTYDLVPHIDGLISNWGGS